MKCIEYISEIIDFTYMTDIQICEIYIWNKRFYIYDIHTNMPDMTNMKEIWYTMYVKYDRYDSYIRYIYKIFDRYDRYVRYDRNKYMQLTEITDRIYIRDTKFMTDMKYITACELRDVQNWYCRLCMIILT